MAARNRIIDIHSHILPGIDDGARTFNDSIAIIRELSNQGITDVIATPHYIDETVYVSPRAKNLKLLAELKDILNAERIPVNVYLGNEIYINEGIIELLKKERISSLADSKYLLVELPMDEEYPNYADYLEDLINYGYKVVLAHPERYTIAQKDFDVLDELYEAGVLLQCNFGSITGKYGKAAQKLAKKLAKNKMIFAFGSDIHRPSKSDYIALARKKLSKYYSDSELKVLFERNPKKIISIH